MATLFLPEDVIFQILIWFPVRSLLRFQSVCRSWCALIRSSHFIQCHAATNTTVDNCNSKLGGTFFCQHKQKTEFYLLSDKGLKEVEDLFEGLCLKDGWRHRRGMRMVGCVNGIICMYNNITGDIGLWNPATRQCRLLPKSLDLVVNPKDWYKHRDFVGLCFDTETNEYKVMRVSSFDREPHGPYTGINSLRKVQIYYLSSDSWKLIDSDSNTDSCRIEPGAGRSLNGFYFHLGLDFTADPIIKPVILSFDLTKEKYQRTVQTPEQDNWVQLELIDDKLACISFPMDPSSRIYKVWMLNDCNTAKELWTELYRIDFMSPEIQTRFGGFCSGILAVSCNGKFGLLYYKTLLCYNSITGEFEDLGFGEGINLNLTSIKATIYKESLVSVNASDSATKAMFL